MNPVRTSQDDQIRATIRVDRGLWERFDKATKKVGSNKSAVLRGSMLQFIESVFEHGGTPEYIPPQTVTKHIEALADED